MADNAQVIADSQSTAATVVSEVKETSSGSEEAVQTATETAKHSSKKETSSAVSEKHENLQNAFSSSTVKDNILTHPLLLKNRSEAGLLTTYISSESRHVMRKGFDMGFTSSNSSTLRVLYDTRIKELEEELEVERSGRYKAEKRRSELEREVSLLTEQLEETTKSSKQHAETIKKREAEYFKLQRDLEDVQTQNEIHLGSFRKKQQDQINQLTEQLDQQHKARQKSEREKMQIRGEADELRGQIEIITQGKASFEKAVKTLESHLAELKRKITDQEKEDRKSVV